MSSLLSVLLLTLFLAALASIPVLRWRSDRLKSYEAWSHRFFEAADPLLQDDETPAEIVDLIEFMSWQLSRPEAAREAFAAIARGRLQEGNIPASVGERLEIVRNFCRRRPELGKKFHEACTASLLAVSYNSVVFGRLLLRGILFDVRRDRDRSERVAIELRETGALAQPA